MPAQPPPLSMPPAGGAAPGQPYPAPGYPGGAPQPVGPAAGAPQYAAAPPPPQMPPEMAAIPLAQSLGVLGRQKFLVHHQVLSFGHSYKVTDHEKNHLFTLHGDIGQNLQSNMLGGMVDNATGSGYMERIAKRSTDMGWTLTNARGDICATVQKTGGANQSMFTLQDLLGRPTVIIQLQRGLMGGITATAIGPNGQPMMQTHGNLIRRTFQIKDPGGRELAKVHEHLVAVGDTYSVDVVGPIDPLFPIVYSILIDYEKVK